MHAEETPPGPAKTPHTSSYILTTANSFICPLFPSFPPHHQLSHRGFSSGCSPKPMLDGVSPPSAAPEPPHLPSPLPSQLLYLTPAQTKAAPNPWDHPRVQGERWVQVPGLVLPQEAQPAPSSGAALMSPGGDLGLFVCLFLVLRSLRGMQKMDTRDLDM